MPDLVSKRFEELGELLQEIDSNLTKEKFVQWGTSVLGLIGQTFGEDSPHFKSFHNNYRAIAEVIGVPTDHYYQTKGIFTAAYEDFKGGYLFDLQQFLRGEIFADFLDQAEYLLGEGYKDAAAVICGGVLEDSLKKICQKNNIVFSPNEGIESLNTKIYNSQVYSLPVKQEITAWGALRNKAAHGDYDEYEDENVRRMIQGVKQLVIDFLR